MEKCNCYEVQQICYMTDPPQYESYSICNGTKYRERCKCEGDPSKCDFYESVRKKAKKFMNTAEMYIVANENGKSYQCAQETIGYSKEKGLFYIYDGTPCYFSSFRTWTFDDFMTVQWKEFTPVKTMTKVEAEKEFGIKIVG